MYLHSGKTPRGSSCCRPCMVPVVIQYNHDKLAEFVSAERKTMSDHSVILMTIREFLLASGPSCFLLAISLV